MEKTNLIVDVEIPFCTGHCVSCERICLGQNISWMNRYIRALEKEIAGASEELAQYHVSSVYIKCDSLSLLGSGALDNFLGKLKKSIPSSEDTQWIVELNPKELTEEMMYVLVLRNHINRFVLPLMALEKRDLITLHAPYTENLADYALSYAKEKEIPGLTITHVFGVPEQTPEELESSLMKLIELNPWQISLLRYHNRRLSLPEQREYAEETDWFSLIGKAEKLLTSHGYRREGKTLHFAREGKLLMKDAEAFRKTDRIGFGLGAFTQMDGFSYQNTTDFHLYLEHSDDPQAIAIM